jgi:hypothetical protein
MMVSREAITPSKVEDRLKDTLDHPTGQTADLVIVYLVPSHPQCILTWGSLSW